MMGKTHLAIGIASALVLMEPQTLSDCLVTIAGGAIGGVLCDIDILDNDYERDIFNVQSMAIGITAIVLVIDYFLQNGICTFISNNENALGGGILFALLCVIGYKSSHRSFTHSFFALFLFSIVLRWFYPPVVNSFAIGFLSHQLLDFLNKKKIRLFYPMDVGLCLGLCYADGIMNKLFMLLGWCVCSLCLLKFIMFSFFHVIY